MNKQEFLAELRKGLSGLPQKDTEERLAFYSEMIEDRMEEGLSEEDAVSAAGKPSEITAQIIEETPFLKIAKERIKSKRRFGAGEIVLLALGSPIWLSLLISAAAVIFSLYVSLWAVIVSLWAVFAATVGCFFGVIVAGIVFICNGSVLTGVAMLAAGIVCSGLSIFMFFGCKAATKGILMFTKKIAVRIKNCFMGKEKAR